MHAPIFFLEFFTGIIHTCAAPVLFTSNSVPVPLMFNMNKRNAFCRQPSKYLLVCKKFWRRLQDISWTRLQGELSVTIFRLPRRLEDVLKTSRKASWKVLKTSSKRLRRKKIVKLKTSSRRLGHKQNLYWDYLYLTNLNLYLTILYLTNLYLTHLRQMPNTLIRTQ